MSFGEDHGAQALSREDGVKFKCEDNRANSPRFYNPCDTGQESALLVQPFV